MFTNLIESNSHAREFKRRGSFFLFTTITYLLLFAIGGIASIYAYDARLDDQNNEEIVLLSPVDLPAPQTAPVAHNVAPRVNDNSRTVSVRDNPMASVNHPELAPATTSAKPNTNPPVPDHGPWVAGHGNSDPAKIDGPGSGGNGVGPATGGGQVSAIEVGTPPPLPTVEKPKPQIIHKSVVLNGEALSLPKPPYPAIAKQLRIQGTVNVQVVIGETGKVISAKAVTGNPALTTAAQQAALQARFSPTMLGEQPVKVSGIITYNFVLQ
jgi:TonB family protein